MRWRTGERDGAATKEIGSEKERYSRQHRCSDPRNAGRWRLLNKQFISAGNLARNSRVALIFMDFASTYASRYWEVFEGERGDRWRNIVQNAGDPARVGRVLTIRVEAYDRDCPQYIVPRYTTEQMESALEPSRKRLEAFEAENAMLKGKLAS